MGSLSLVRKPSLAFAFGVVLLCLATQVAGQRAIPSLGSKLKRFGGRSEKGAKGKLVPAEGENHVDKQKDLCYYLGAVIPWDLSASFVSFLVDVLFFGIRLYPRYVSRVSDTGTSNAAGTVDTTRVTSRYIIHLAQIVPSKLLTHHIRITHRRAQQMIS